MLPFAIDSVVSPIQIQRRSLPAQVPYAPLASKTQCSTCLVKDICLPSGLKGNDVHLLDGMLFGHRKVRSGQPLYREGDKFQFLYAMRSGTFKSSLTSPDGIDQVIAFHMAGEVMGLDGVAQGAYSSTATALEDTELCAISYAHLTELAANSPGLHHIVGRLMSFEISREHRLMLMLGSMNAEERLAAFLLDISRRLELRGFSAHEFHLRMSRADIGSYLGLTLETISRTFSAFQRTGILKVRKKHVRVVDHKALARTLEPHED